MFSEYIMGLFTVMICSILGTAFIIVGLNAFLWGKGKELKQAVAQHTSHKQNTDHNEQVGDEIA